MEEEAGMRSEIEVAARAAYLAWYDAMGVVCPPWDFVGPRAQQAWKIAAQEAAISFAQSRNPNPPIAVAIVDKIDG